MSNVITQYVDADLVGTIDTGPEVMALAALQASARMLYKIEDYAALQELGGRYEDQFASDTDLLVMLANAYVKTRDVDRAFTICDAAHTLDTTRPAVLERLITLCLATRQPDRQASLLDDHERLFPGRTAFRRSIKR